MAGPKRILVIDDDESLVGPIKEYLEGAGFQVSVAFDGMQGVLQAHAATPDLILLDFTMPAGGGATVYERLRNANDTARIPIIFTTAVALEEVKGKIKPSARTYFLKKPVTLTQVGMVVGQVLGVKVENPDASAAARWAAAPAPAPSPAPAREPTPLPEQRRPEEPRRAEPPTRDRFSRDAPRPFGSPPSAMSPAAASPPARVPFFPEPPEPARAAPPPLSASPAPAPASLRSEPGEGRFHEFEVRVTYADTDKMGIIYYANYFRYFELGRTELLRSLGVRYRDLELERKLYIPIVEARCQYLGPSRYDDLLIVRTWLSWIGPASVCFQYEIFDREGSDRLVARGFSRHAVVNDKWRPTRVPSDLRGLLEPYVRSV